MKLVICVLFSLKYLVSVNFAGQYLQSSRLDTACKYAKNVRATASNVSPLLIINSKAS